MSDARMAERLSIAKSIGTRSLGHRLAHSGDTLAVSTYLESSCATGINGDQTNNGCFGAGATYIFTRTAGVWNQQAYVKSSNTEADEHFGTTVALSGDTLAVGAIREDIIAAMLPGRFIFSNGRMESRANRIM
jgi:trimeric autotransporter adhesin